MRKIQALFAFFLLLLAGCSTDSNTGTTTVIPLAPTNLTATVISTTQVNLQWTDNSTNETGYKVQRKTGGGNFADIASTAPDATSYSDASVSPNTTYTYRAYAYNSAGNSLQYSNEVTVTTNLIPIITTAPISDTTVSSAKCGGNITSDAGSPVTARGVCWSTTSGPTIALSTKTTDGTGTGSFISNITGLSANTTYYVRAYATNANGTAYGNEVSFTTAAIDITTGLVGYWPFNGNANDESGNGNNGTVNGATLTADRFGNANKAYSFNGASNITTNSLLLNTQSISISGWINLASYNSAGRRIINSLNFGTDPSAFSIAVLGSPGPPGNVFQSCFSNGCQTTNYVVPLNTYIHFASIINSGVAINYINGQQVLTNNGLSSLLDFNDGLVIGGTSMWGFSGKLDDIRIYNRALTQSEVTYLATH